MQNEGKNSPNKINYSIWETRTKENLDTLKEEFAVAMESTNFKSKTTPQKD